MNGPAHPPRSCEYTLWRPDGGLYLSSYHCG